MTMERWIRMIAGTFVLVSLALGVFVSGYFLWFTAFVGFNLFQSSLTNWCLMEKILARLGVPLTGRPAAPSGQAKPATQAP